MVNIRDRLGGGGGGDAGGSDTPTEDGESPQEANRRRFKEKVREQSSQSSGRPTRREIEQARDRTQTRRQQTTADTTDNESQADGSQSDGVDATSDSQSSSPSRHERVRRYQDRLRQARSRTQTADQDPTQERTRRAETSSLRRRERRERVQANKDRTYQQRAQARRRNAPTTGLEDQPRDQTPLRGLEANPEQARNAGYADEVQAYNQQIQKQSNLRQDEYAIRSRTNDAGEVTALFVDVDRDAVAQRRARELEQTLTEEHPDLDSSEDFNIVREDDQLAVEWTDQGKQKLARERQETAQEQAEILDSGTGLSDAEIEVQTGADLDESGTVAYERQQDPFEHYQTGSDMATAIDEGRLDEETTVTVDVGEEYQEVRTAARDRAADSLATQVTENHPGLDRGEDFTIEREDQTITAQYTDEGKRQVLRSKAREEHPDAEQIAITRNDEGDLVAAIKGGQQQQQERFGDVTLTVPFTGGETVEDYLKAGASTYSSAAEDIAQLSTTGGVYESNNPRTAFKQGTVRGALELGNVPGVLLGAKEGAETVGWAGGKAIKGEGGDAWQKLETATGTAVASGVKYAESNPYRSGGQLLGSVVGSYGAIAGASRASARAGRATAYAIQPGEELLTSGLNKLPGLRGLGSSLPGGRLDTEELAIHGARKAKDTISPAARRAKSELTSKASPTVRRFLADERGQGQLGRIGSRSVDSDATEISADDIADPSSSPAQRTVRPESEQEADVAYDSPAARQQRRRVAEESQVERGRSEINPTGGSRLQKLIAEQTGADADLREQAVSRSLDGEATARTTGRFEANLLGGETQMETVMESIGQRQAEATESRVASPWESARDQAGQTERESILDRRQSLDLERVLETELAKELSAKTETESAFEQTLELELGVESRRGVEADATTNDDSLVKQALGKSSIWARQYQNEIASPAEVMGW